MCTLVVIRYKICCIRNVFPLYHSGHVKCCTTVTCSSKHLFITNKFVGNASWIHRKDASLYLVSLKKTSRFSVRKYKMTSGTLIEVQQVSVEHFLIGKERFICDALDGLLETKEISCLGKVHVEENV